MKLLCCWLVLVALISVTFSVNPGVKVKLTQKGLEYGRQLGMASIQRKLQSIKIPDFSGKERVSRIGKVKYSFTNIQMRGVSLPTSAVNLVAGSGVKLSMSNAFISLHGNWRVRYKFIRTSGSFDLKVNGLAISTVINMQSDGTGRPVVSAANCAASVGSVDVKFHRGAGWLINLFRKKIEKALKKKMQDQLCPLVANAISDLNPQLKTLNVLAKVDKFAEIEYSMVSSPAVSQSAVELSLKGEFYNIGKHQEPPFSPAAFSLPPQNNNMLYMGLSAFTANSAGFVYNTAGALSLYITDDMIPQSSPVRLTTTALGFLVPQIAVRFPGLMVKLLVKAEKNPKITFQPNKATAEATGTVTAYAIQTNGTLTPLFVLNLETSVSTKVSVSGMNLAGEIDLNEFSLTLKTSNVGSFPASILGTIIRTVVKLVVIPRVNVQLARGYPLPAIGKMKLVNTQVQVLKDYMMIGTDVQFTS